MCTFWSSWKQQYHQARLSYQEDKPFHLPMWTDSFLGKWNQDLKMKENTKINNGFWLDLWFRGKKYDFCFFFFYLWIGNICVWWTARLQIWIPMGEWQQVEHIFLDLKIPLLVKRLSSLCPNFLQCQFLHILRSWCYTLISQKQCWYRTLRYVEQMVQQWMWLWVLGILPLQPIKSRQVF